MLENTKLVPIQYNFKHNKYKLVISCTCDITCRRGNRTLKLMRQSSMLSYMQVQVLYR